ncbi:uncharacterized protein LOC116778890 [Danaus plexippus]|uniref:uncharacterized protein LOC116778890 n=1 Tax=Danaus plexippus TaxID=13037 RepID=UPI002AB2DBD5|nr:uncharacterized protein LOC116778890 [Danaus plexippus]
MYKLIIVLVVSAAVLAEGRPSLAKELVESAKSGNWDLFHELVRQQHALADWAFDFTSDVENLKPVDGANVSGHSIIVTKQWSDDGTNHSEHGEGREVINDNGQVTVRRFQI